MGGRVLTLTLALVLVVGLVAGVIWSMGGADRSQYTARPIVRDPIECAAAGGQLGRGGFDPLPICLVRFADAGRPCTDGDQCEGNCLAEPGPSAPGAAAKGTCETLNHTFGCHHVIEGGKVLMRVCRE